MTRPIGPLSLCLNTEGERSLEGEETGQKSVYSLLCKEEELSPMSPEANAKNALSSSHVTSEKQWPRPDALLCSPSSLH